MPVTAIIANYPALARAFRCWDIYEPMVMIGLIGTIMKESGSFYPVRESWWVYDQDPAAAKRYYENTALHAAYSGGWWFHGRGYIQATHDYAYNGFNQAVIERFGIDLGVGGNPERMLEIPVSAHFAAWFFIQKGLVEVCRAGDWREARRLVWGAYGDTVGVMKLQTADASLRGIAAARGYA